MTPEERKLWFGFLRSYPIRFQRQKILGPYVADFCCAKAGLVLELDGSQHYEGRGPARDAARTAEPAEYGAEVIRIPNNWIHENFDGVCAYLDLYLKQKLQQS